MPVDPGPPGWWTAALVVMVILAVIGIAISIWRFEVLRRGGLNPLAAKEQLEVMAADRLARDARASQETGPRESKSIEERLAELDDLYQRGVISDDERREARAKVISDG